MTSDELQRIFRQVLKTSVPVVGLSLCGATPGAKTARPPEKKPLLSEALSDVSRAHSLGPCGSEADQQAQQDPNYAQSPVDRKVVRRLTDMRFEEWKKAGRTIDAITCQDLCIGTHPEGLAALTLSDGTLARVRIQRSVVTCLPPAAKPHPTITCSEVWRITGTDCSPQKKLNLRPPDEEDEPGGLQIGRRPATWQPRGRPPAESVGARLARFAAMEAASVPAFQTLHDDLTRHGAPTEFAERALHFADDEVRHTRMMTALARRFGAEPELPDVPASGARGLEEVIVENMVEGCVRETFGALLAHWQSTHATDAGIREAMTRIADDETRHAALAWDIHEWAMPRLSFDSRQRIDEAKHRTVDALMHGADSDDADVRSVLGLPDAIASVALAERLQALLWT